MISEATKPVTDPVELELRRSGKGVEVDLFVPDRLLYFRGHFSGFPVLPGVVQLHWAIAFGRRQFNLGAASIETIQMKFRSLIRPEERICLILVYDQARRKLSFEFRDAHAIRSSGVVSFTT